MSDFTEEVEEFRCPVEWQCPRSLCCNPHQCDLTEGHDGKHQCSCGRQRRNTEPLQSDARKGM